jgi:hypothetical protein
MLKKLPYEGYILIHSKSILTTCFSTFASMVTIPGAAVCGHHIKEFIPLQSWYRLCRIVSSGTNEDRPDGYDREMIIGLNVIKSGIIALITSIICLLTFSDI